MIDTTKVVIPEPIDVYRERCKQLEQLCLDLWTCAHETKCWNCPKFQGVDTDCEVLNEQRLVALGLLEEEGGRVNGRIIGYVIGACMVVVPILVLVAIIVLLLRIIAWGIVG